MPIIYFINKSATKIAKVCCDTLRLPCSSNLISYSLFAFDGSACLPLPSWLSPAVSRQWPPECSGPWRSAASPFIVDRRAQRAFHAFVHYWWLRLSCGCSTCMEQFAGHCHIVPAIAADIQETTQDRTVCSQLSRLLAAATYLTLVSFFSFRIARTSLSRYSFL